MDVERAAPVTMSAGDAVGGLPVKLGIMIGGKAVPDHGEVVVLVYQADVQPSGAGLAVVAVHAPAIRIIRRERADRGVVLLLCRGIEEAKQLFHIILVPYPWQDSQHARLVEGILDALVSGYFLTEGGGVSTQELACGKRLHHRDSYAIRLTALVERHPLARASVRILAMLVVIGGVDGEHQLVHQSCIEYLRSKRWCV